MLYDGMGEVTPEKGSLLVSEPMMSDPVFGRSVVLILEKDADHGFIGLVLNKKTDMTMGDLIPDWEMGKKVPVFSGGPVDPGRLFMLHTLGERLAGSHEVFPGIWVGGELRQIVDLIQKGEDVEGNMRFFMGYSGWTKGQLESEIRRNSWAVQPSLEPESILTGKGERYWQAEVERLGERFRSWLIVPTNPDMN